MIKPGRDSKSKDSKANFLGLEHQVDISLPIKNAKSISFSDPSLTKTWDKGSKHVRQRILAQFLKEMTNATGPQLDKEFNNGASLFLLRISAWLRLTYLLGFYGGNLRGRPCHDFEGNRSICVCSVRK
jgi:hypothetical protein